MYLTPVLAQAVGSAGGGDFMDMVKNFGIIPIMLIPAYFLLIRPQQQQAKAHRAAIAAVKRGDTVVLASGVIGKVVRVEETEVGLEIAQGVTVKVVKDRIAEVKTRGAPAAANDAKS